MPRKANGRISSNPTLPPYVSIILDKPRRLLFDINALIALGDEIKENMLSDGCWDRALGITRDANQKSISVETTPRNLRALLWSALLADDPEITVQQAGALLQPRNLQRIMAAVNDAIRVQNEESEDDIRPTEAELAKEESAAQ